MKYLDCNKINKFTPLRTSFYIRATRERHTNLDANETCIWSGVKYTPINLKSIYHLPIYLLQIVKITPEWETAADFYWRMCAPITICNLHLDKNYRLGCIYFSYGLKKFPIEIYKNNICVYIANGIIIRENITLNTIEQIPEVILKLKNS